MMKRLCFGVFAMTVALTSCDRIYREYDKKSFPSYTWQSGQEVVFKPSVKDVTRSYELVLGLRHVYGLKLQTLSMKVRRISPSGKETTKDYEIALMNDRGDYISSCGGDLCDIEVAVESNFKFEEAGTYQFIITHNMPLQRVPGIMEVGLIINESD